MAQRVTVLMIDDVDGQEANETVTFGLDGVQYEIDLHATNASQLRADLKVWVDNGRRAGGRKTSRRAIGSTSSRDERAKIRDWAQKNGHSIGDRGRIAQPIVDAYHATTA